MRGATALFRSPMEQAPAAGDPSDSGPPLIRLTGISKRFAEQDALVDISFDVARNSFVSIVGHSGCGKSTLLRILAGLEAPTGGAIAIGGMATETYRRQRPFGFVFQEAALFPWKTTLENVRLPLDILGIGTRSERDRRARDLLSLVRLGGFEDRYPAHLSGGMRQRASIARALAYSPEILLMDEPFGALDDFTRRELGHELLRIWEERQCTVLFVTHSLLEAVLLSDTVIVMDAHPGRIRKIVRIGLPRPRNADVRASAEFAGHVAELEHLIFGGA